MTKRLIFTIAIICLMIFAGCSGKNDMPSVSAQKAESESDAKAVLPDGEYSVELALEGGSGKASVASPAKIIMQDGTMTAEIIWSSSHYDYMILDGTKYLAEVKDEKSYFYIPVDASNEVIDIVADTTAMSQPHEIEYRLIFSWDSLMDSAGENVAASFADVRSTVRSDVLLTHDPISNRLISAGRMETDYAGEFDVWYYEGGYRELRISDGTRILVVPENGEIPSDLDDDVKVLKEPVKDIYLVSTSVMDYFDKTDSLDRLKFASMEAGDWESENANEKMKNGDIKYAGKYSAPDYEMLTADGCGLVIENTMILHSPGVAEKLEELGFPVIIDMSSYESDPLGRAEWIRFYGALLGCEDRADAAFDKQKDTAERIREEAANATSGESKTVLIFYFTDNGMINIKDSSDYLAAMIEMCGADYLYKSPDGNKPGSSSLTISSEDFYSMALNADILIYNTTIAGDVDSREDLTADYSLISSFSAYKTDSIYKMNANVFQNPMSAGEIMEEMYSLITGEYNDQGVFFERLK